MNGNLSYNKHKRTCIQTNLFAKEYEENNQIFWNTQLKYALVYNKKSEIIHQYKLFINLKSNMSQC